MEATEHLICLSAVVGSRVFKFLSDVDALETFVFLLPWKLIRENPTEAQELVNTEVST